jgi:hypothetical protein
MLAVVGFVLFLVAQFSWGLFESRMIRIGHRFTFSFSTAQNVDKGSSGANGAPL